MYGITSGGQSTSRHTYPNFNLIIPFPVASYYNNSCNWRQRPRAGFELSLISEMLRKVFRVLPSADFGRGQKRAPENERLIIQPVTCLHPRFRRVMGCHTMDNRLQLTNQKYKIETSRSPIRCTWPLYAVIKGGLKTRFSYTFIKACLTNCNKFAPVAFWNVTARPN
jgi:hypothetical protein